MRTKKDIPFEACRMRTKKDIPFGVANASTNCPGRLQYSFMMKACIADNNRWWHIDRPRKFRRGLRRTHLGAADVRRPAFRRTRPEATRQSGTPHAPR